MFGVNAISPTTTPKIITAPRHLNQLTKRINGHGHHRTYQSDDWIYRLRAVMREEDKLEQLKNLLAKGEHKKAVADFGKTAQENFDTPAYIDWPCLQTILADIKVHYSKALIRTGEIKKGIALLKEVIKKMERGRDPDEVVHEGKSIMSERGRRNLVLGRAHNHLGYIYYRMEKEFHEPALQEFSVALIYFRASNWREEEANTYHNMGRVYLLRDQPRLAMPLIEYSLKLRKLLGDEHRIALSLNSLAMAHLESGDLPSALEEAKKSLDIFKKLDAPRGIGLACITVGRVLRQWGDTTSLMESEVYLNTAVNKFSKNKSIGWYIKTCQDLGLRHAQIGQPDEADYWLQKAEQAIPGSDTDR